MNVYSVFLRADLAPAQALERAKLVKQGLSWEALLATPVWAVRHGLWLGLGSWIGAIVAIALVAAAAHLSAWAVLFLYWLCVLAFALEADRLREARLAKAGFLMQGLAIGSSSQDAEGVYFATHGSEKAAKLPNDLGPGRGPPPAAPAAETDLLGLFPSREPRL